MPLKWAILPSSRITIHLHYLLKGHYGEIYNFAPTAFNQITEDDSESEAESDAEAGTEYVDDSDVSISEDEIEDAVR